MQDKAQQGILQRVEIPHDEMSIHWHKLWIKCFQAAWMQEYRGILHVPYNYKGIHIARLPQAPK
jgi:hypothetical protein